MPESTESKQKLYVISGEDLNSFSLKSSGRGIYEPQGRLFIISPDWYSYVRASNQLKGIGVGGGDYMHLNFPKASREFDLNVLPADQLPILNEKFDVVKVGNPLDTPESEPVVIDVAALLAASAAREQKSLKPN